MNLLAIDQDNYTHIQEDICVKYSRMTILDYAKYDSIDVIIELPTFGESQGGSTQRRPVINKVDDFVALR